MPRCPSPGGYVHAPRARCLAILSHCHTNGPLYVLRVFLVWLFFLFVSLLGFASTSKGCFQAPLPTGVTLYVHRMGKWVRNREWGVRDHNQRSIGARSALSQRSRASSPCQQGESDARHHRWPATSDPNETNNGEHRRKSKTGLPFGLSAKH